MIEQQTQLIIADTTVARKIMQIGILGSNKSYANVDDVIIDVIK